ncbi:MAG TPA: signal peptidase II [Solirubrobacteraceae bacterium]|nr:signal peptidase II [Solirubrobacteraceae bacterium]
MRPAGGAWARVAAVTAGIVAFDQATKALVRANLERGDRETVLPGVELVHSRNTGVAFGALSGGGAVVTVVIAVALVALLAYFATHIRRPLVWLPTGMLLGGAIGNVIDRVRHGAVTDFIQIPLGFPAFNVADMSITFGVLVLFFVLERDGAHGER